MIKYTGENENKKTTAQGETISELIKNMIDKEILQIKTEEDINELIQEFSKYNYNKIEKN